MKPLKQSDFKATIVNDLGMVRQGKIKVRKVELQCNICKSLFTGTASNIKNKEHCNVCSRLEANKKLMVDLDQKDYKMQLIKDLGIEDKHRWAIFQCNECGMEFRTRAFAPGTKNQTKCSTCQNTSKRSCKHPLYAVWNGIKQRCYNPKRKDYYNYGAKGVTMSKEWVDDPVAFITWCESNGWKPGLIVDKDIKSRQLGIHPHRYSPETITFTTYSNNSIESHGKCVFKCSLSGDVLETFPSGSFAASYIGKSRSFVYKLCLNKSEYNGFIYKYSK